MYSLRWRSNKYKVEFVVGSSIPIADVYEQVHRLALEPPFQLTMHKRFPQQTDLIHFITTRNLISITYNILNFDAG